MGYNDVFRYGDAAPDHVTWCDVIQWRRAASTTSQRRVSRGRWRHWWACALRSSSGECAPTARLGTWRTWHRALLRAIRQSHGKLVSNGDGE